MHRQQLDGGNAQRLDVVDDFLDAEAGIRASQMRRNAGMKLGEPFDMRFIDNCVVPRQPLGARLAVPIKIGIYDHAFRHERCAVAFVKREIHVLGADGVAKTFRRPLHLADVCPRVRIKHQLIGIKAVAAIGS